MKGYIPSLVRLELWWARRLLVALPVLGVLWGLVASQLGGSLIPFLAIGSLIPVFVAILTPFGELHLDLLPVPRRHVVLVRGITALVVMLLLFVLMLLGVFLWEAMGVATVTGEVPPEHWPAKVAGLTGAFLLIAALGWWLLTGFGPSRWVMPRLLGVIVLFLCAVRGAEWTVSRLRPEQLVPAGIATGWTALAVGVLVYLAVLPLMARAAERRDR